ncbi:hypothetical protein [Azonexus sp. R2A61]|uniref:hypothetical protein n=1 Tax=Azonexus sp. R2A61 TaxID=2744443 RepID=UPI001F340F98|nr:hypothetical protein [Azonexus sp. R2A61]
MRKEIIFHSAKNPRLQGELEPVRGYVTAFGLVIHRSLTTFREVRGYWDVSDITTGAQVAMGEYPGIEGAVAALVNAAQRFASYPSGFSGALAEGRRRAAVVDAIALSAFPGGEMLIIDERAIAELYAGLNATAIKMRDGTEYLVHEAAEVIRYRIHERTGISVPIV